MPRGVGTLVQQTLPKHMYSRKRSNRKTSHSNSITCQSSLGLCFIKMKLPLRCPHFLLQSLSSLPKETPKSLLSQRSNEHYLPWTRGQFRIHFKQEMGAHCTGHWHHVDSALPSVSMSVTTYPRFSVRRPHDRAGLRPVAWHRNRTKDL